MNEKNKLKDRDLEKVNGGETCDSLENLRFLFGIGYHVEVNTFRIPYIHQFTKSGTLTRCGYIHVGKTYIPVYYITCDDNSYSGWYDEAYLQDYTYSRWSKIDESKTPVTPVECE